MSEDQRPRVRFDDLRRVVIIDQPPPGWRSLWIEAGRDEAAAMKFLDENLEPYLSSIADWVVRANVVQTRTHLVFRDVLKPEGFYWDRSTQIKIGLCLKRLGFEKVRKYAGMWYERKPV